MIDPEAHVSVNRTAIAEAERALQRQSIRSAEELRALRLRAGLSQAAVARNIGVARSLVSRLERGDPGIALRTRFRIATVLGADLRLAAFAGSGLLIRDSVQAGIIEGLLATAATTWRPTVEASIPGPGRRSVDLRLDGPSDIVLIEVETRIGSLEEIIRELHSKRQALAEEQQAEGGPTRRPIHVVLALPATRHHQLIVAAHPKTISTAFPIPSRALARALATGTSPWPGDGILWIPRDATSKDRSI